MVRCAFSSIWRRADLIGRTILAVAVFAGTLGGPVPLALANAGSNVTEEIECLALTIYFEARGEPDEGKIAVGYVVMNRAQNPLFPEKICSVVRQGGIKRYRCQFTWWCSFFLLWYSDRFKIEGDHFSKAMMAGFNNP